LFPALSTPATDVGLERVPFLDQLVDALGICSFDTGQSLQTPMPARTGAGLAIGKPRGFTVCRYRTKQIPSVDELIEEGNAFERLDVVAGVKAPGTTIGRSRTREVAGG